MAKRVYDDSALSYVNSYDDDDETYDPNEEEFLNIFKIPKVSQESQQSQELSLESSSNSTMGDEPMGQRYAAYSKYFSGGKKRKLSKAAVALARAADAEQRRSRFEEAVGDLKSIIAQNDGLMDVVTDPEYKASRISGSGAYRIGALTKGARKLFGNKIIGAVNDRIVSGISGRGRYTGRGLYQANNLIDGGRPSMEFSSPNDETQSLVISHCEYMGDVFAPNTSSFTNNAYAINPGLMNNFPFLAQFAQNFSEYELIQMVFHFRSTVDSSATSNANGNTGTIIMGTQYEFDEGIWTTKEDMMGAHGTQSGRLTEDLDQGVECDPNKVAISVKKFVRAGPVFNAGNLSTYDLGIFQIATQNIPNAFFNQQVGELWVTYRVKLSKPKLYTALANSVTAYRAVSKGGETVSNLLGTDLLTAYNNNIAMSVTNPSAGVVKFTWPATASGVFQIMLKTEGSVIVPSGASASYTGNISYWSDIYAAEPAGDNPAAYFTGNFNSTSSTTIIRVLVKAATGSTDNSLLLIPLGTTATGTITQTYIEVQEIGSYFQTSNSVNTPIFVNSVGIVTAP